MTAAGDPPATPRPAATVVLVRDLPRSGVEVLLVQRHGKIGFMGGMYVFPGGTLSPDDERLAEHAPLDAAEDERLALSWGRGLGRALALGLAVTAVRETFEEAGVLLGSALAAAERAALRARLLAGESFAALLEEGRVSLRLGELTPLSRWITPALEPKRYDTLFFLARAPADQRAEHDAGETVASAWLSPDAALAKRDTGELKLAPPTARTLETLREAESFDAARALAERRRPPLIEPIIRAEGDELVILYPGDPEHPEPERALVGPTRHVLRRL